MTAAKKHERGGVVSILVLTIICLVISGALVGTYQVTKPIIDANKALGNAALAELLPESEGMLSEINTDKLEDIGEIFEADNGAGYVIGVVDKGFGGEMSLMVGVNKAGKVSGIKVTEHNETPNLGTKALEEDYLAQYEGKGDITISGEDGKEQVDAVAGATVSSEAVFRAVDKALQQFHKMGGGA